MRHNQGMTHFSQGLSNSPLPCWRFPSGTLFCLKQRLSQKWKTPSQIYQLLTSMNYRFLHYLFLSFLLQPDFSNHNIGNWVLHGLVVLLRNLFRWRTFYLPILKEFSPYSWVLYSDISNVRWDLLTPSSKFQLGVLSTFPSFVILLVHISARDLRPRVKFPSGHPTPVSHSVTENEWPGRQR